LEIKRLGNVLKVDGIRIFFRKILSGLQMLSNIEVIYALGYMGFAVLGLALHYFFFSYPPSGPVHRS
jgi:hypothetical protein